MAIRRGEVYLVNLNPVQTRIQGGIISASYKLENIKPGDEFEVVIIP